METSITERLTKLLPRDLFLDLFDMAIAKAHDAHLIIKERTPLTGKSARGAEGQIRYRIVEHCFPEICELHGATRLQGNILSGESELRFYQPFMRFGGAKDGIVLGLASIPSKRKLPSKNQSRKAGISLNVHLTPRLELDERDPKTGDIFVLFLTARDPSRAGQIAEVAIGIIDSKYENWIFYESIEKLMARYSPEQPQPAPSDPTPPKNTSSLVKLKKSSKPYAAPEIGTTPKDADRNSDS